MQAPTQATPLLMPLPCTSRWRLLICLAPFHIYRGFIVDVSLKGTSLEQDVDDMEAAYGEGTTPADVLMGSVRPPRQAQLLYNALAALEGRIGA
jgi:hypothetical protein